MPGPRIYLDNAATSWPKPEAVYLAVDDYQRRLGAPAGRSGYSEALEVNQRIEIARAQLARLLNAPKRESIIFTLNGTDSLNLALHGLLKPGDHVITSVVDHNSVLRPLRSLQEAGLIEVSRIACDASGMIDPDAVRTAITPATRLIALTHASNVTGALQLIERVAAIANEAGALFLLDAAQTAGHVPIDVKALFVDLLAAPGHKGLLGPLGTGILYVKPGVERQLASVRQGGTGTRSEDDHQPDALPHKYEAGNLNVPGIFGLGAAVDYLLERGVSAIGAQIEKLTERLLEGLNGIEGIRVYGPLSAKARVGVVSIAIEGYDPQEAAAMLDAVHRIQVRPGLHCAPCMHKSLGTIDSGGTLRLSLGAFTTSSEIDAAIAAISEMAAAVAT